MHSAAIRSLREALVALSSLLTLAASVSSAAAAEPSGFPLLPGTRWVYEGTAACAATTGDLIEKAGTRRTNATGCVWTALPSTGAVYRASVRWVMEVVESAATNGVRAAVVRGYSSDLAWADFGREPGWCVLAVTSSKVVRLEADGQREARRLLRRAVASPRTALGEPEVNLPLKVNQRWGGDTQRDDGWYCWRVEASQRVNLSDLGGAGSRDAEVFTLAYRTGPDHTVVGFARGLGIVHYQYKHHGTIASVDVRLVKVLKPAARPNPAQR